MHLTSFPVADENYDECLNVRLNDEDIGQVYADLEKNIRWFYFAIPSEVTEGPFPTRRAAEKALAKHHDPNYGTVDDDTLEDLQQELIRLLNASSTRADAKSPGQKNYRYGIATAYDALTRVLRDHPLLNAEFQANEVRED